MDEKFTDFFGRPKMRGKNRMQCDWWMMIGEQHGNDNNHQTNQIQLENSFPSESVENRAARK